MSSARSARGAKTEAPRISNATAPAPTTFTLPNLTSLFVPALNTNTNNANVPCNCGCCCQTSTTVCLTFDTTWLQNLVNMFPKVQITNNNSCVDSDCGCEDDDVSGK
jgi:hypothetical protein